MSNELQELSNKFNSLLTEYTDTYQKYMDAIKTKDATFTTIKDFSFSSDSNIDTLNDTDVENCKTSCLSNSSCIGATFNNSSNSCLLSGGTNGKLVSASDSTAIVKQAMYYSHELQRLNAELIDINKQIMTLTKNKYSEFKQSQKQVQDQDQAINNNYRTLEQERMQINQMVRQFEIINSAYEDGNIHVTSNYYSYIVLLFIAILLVLLFIKFSINGEQSGGGSNPIKMKYVGIFLMCAIIILLSSSHKFI
jgi:hypothetical protein